MMQDDFIHVRRVTADSLQGQLARGAGRLARQAWLDSRLRAIAGRTRLGLTQSSVVERTRVVALAVAVGAVFNAAARTIMAPYSAPALPIAFVIATAIVAGLVASMPEAFIAAWRESRIAPSKQR
jgi:hypothetical protein